MGGKPSQGTSKDKRLASNKAPAKAVPKGNPKPFGKKK